jgi:hypothetical protein
MLSELGKTDPRWLHDRLSEEFARVAKALQKDDKRQTLQKQTLEAYQALEDFLKGLGEAGNELDQPPSR